MPYLLTDAEYAEFKRLTGKPIGGAYVRTGPGGTTIGRGDQAAERRPLRGGSTVVLVKITGPAPGGGKYFGRIALPPTTATIDPNTTLGVGELADFPATDDALIVNLTEVGVATHDLTNVRIGVPYVFGLQRGISSDGKRVVLLNGFDLENCT